MFALISSFLFLLAGGPNAPEGGFTRFYNEYLNIPGFEAWKFLNLGIFVALMVYLLKKPLSEAFKAKRDAIRAELIKAEEEKQAALVKLTEAEGKLSQLETEKENVIAKAREEAEVEKKRIADHAKLEAVRIRQQAEAELVRIQSQSRAELRRFSAEESIRLAESKLRSRIDGPADARLVKANIQEIGGLN
jgi:F-type H+-transporting ATPase subunit b